MAKVIRSIPRPLVRTNQWLIVISVLVSWVSGQSWVLAIPLINGLFGLLTGFNPVIRGAKLFLRKAPSAYAQEDFDQQQFNQRLAVAFLALGWIGFLAGRDVIGYIFSAGVLLAALIAILGFCVGCFLRYRLQQFRYHRAEAMRKNG